MKLTRRAGIRGTAAGAAAALIVLGAGPVHAAGPDLLTWGRNTNGELADGTTTNRTTPVFPTLAPGSSVTDISGGELHSAFLISTGQIFTMGSDQFGQLGNGVTGGNFTTPVAVVMTGLPAGVTFVEVSAGISFTIARASNGSVWAWGLNDVGQLGNGTNTNSNVPVAVSLPVGETATAIVAGAQTGYAITASGAVLAWGLDNAGQLGNGAPLTNSNVPVNVNLSILAGSPVAIASRRGWALIILDDTGGVYTVGHDSTGQLCNGAPLANSSVLVAVTVPPGVTVAAVGAGRLQSFLISTTGAVYGCGENNNGELGDGTTTDRNVPTLMTLPPGAVATAVEGGTDFTLVLTTAGKVMATGYNGFGQMGDGTTTQRLTPVSSLIGSGSTMNLISAGGYHALAVGTFSLTGVPLAKPWIVAAGAALLLLIATAWGIRRRIGRQA